MVYDACIEGFMIKEISTTDLTQDLYQLIKRLPHLKLNIERIPGLTNSEHELLVVLRMNTNAEKPMLSASEISSLLHITPAGGTHLLNPLVRAGYLQRMQDARDRRIALISLTDQGIAAADTLLADLHGIIRGLIKNLGEDDSRRFIDLLSKVIDYLVAQPAPPNERKNDR